MTDVADELVQAGLTLPPEPVEEYRSCEINKHCQDILVQRSPGPSHIFTDIMDYLPQRCLEKVLQLKPKDDASRKEAAQCHARIKTYLQRRKKLIMNSSSTSPCLKHGMHCLQHPIDNGIPTMAVAGSNCQPYSMAGSRTLEADARILPAIVLQTQTTANGGRLCWH